MGTGVLLWLAAAAGATAVGMAAVGMIGSDIFGSSQDPLTQAEVEQRLAAPTTGPTGAPTGPSTGATDPATPSAEPTAAPSSTPPATPPPAARARVVNALGAGTVTAQCNADGTVQILAVSPAQGYEADPDDDAADDHPKITFESDAVEVEVRLRCADGVVTDEIEQKIED
ncbi:hypothetical protein SAMN04488561_1161 [Jiangella alba]|uniref:Serine/threonine protein kinase n=1 Tax=Jiangella alba TaxID=561176 RepID=A0A1H5IFW6_9ACTN|nr:hypothetical protein SAMN04488561_1161 [Jiangella alba]